MFLNKCITFDAIPSLDDILEDEWLENLRHTDLFRDFIEQIKNIGTIRTW